MPAHPRFPRRHQKVRRPQNPKTGDGERAATDRTCQWGKEYCYDLRIKQYLAHCGNHLPEGAAGRLRLYDEAFLQCSYLNYGWTGFDESRSVSFREIYSEGGNDKPQILIYHTHSQEEYSDFASGNKEATVVGIGII